MTLQVLRLFILIPLCFVTTVNSAEILNTDSNAVTIVYNKSTDYISIDAKSASLRQVLKIVALKTGIAVMFDNKAEGTVSLNIKSNNLKKGLENLLNGRNYSFLFDTDKQNNTLLTGIMILPADSKNKRNAKHIINIEKEARQRAISQLSLEQTSEINLAKERWQKRLDNMPKRFRQDLEERIDQHLAKKALTKQKLETNKKDRKLKHNQHNEKHQTQRNSYLESMDPDQRVAYEQYLHDEQNSLSQQLVQQLQSK